VASRPTTALFVRIPPEQARELDRLAFESRRPKQAVVSELLSRYIGEPAGRRITIDTREEPETVVGHYAFRADEPDRRAREPDAASPEPDVLTLEELADLLRADPRELEKLAGRGGIPGRRIGGSWRFSRDAVIEWLGESSPPEPGEE
jgi:excisionase family DNA binding protein